MGVRRVMNPVQFVSLYEEERDTYTGLRPHDNRKKIGKGCGCKPRDTENRLASTKEPGEARKDSTQGLRGSTALLTPGLLGSRTMQQ